MTDENKPYLATLKHGNVYYLRSQRFDFDVPVPVDEDTKNYLEENAIDPLTFTDSNGGVTVQDRKKFEFAAVDPEDAAKIAAATPKTDRVRRRS